MTFCFRDAYAYCSHCRTHDSQAVTIIASPPEFHRFESSHRQSASPLDNPVLAGTLRLEGVYCCSTNKRKYKMKEYKEAIEIDVDNN